jgi:hypothetical protein
MHPALHSSVVHMTKTRNGSCSVDRQPALVGRFRARGHARERCRLGAVMPACMRGNVTHACSRVVCVLG